MGTGVVSTLPHVIWDMGGILYPYFTELLVETGKARGWPLERLALGPTGSVPDLEYERLLEGDLEESEYVAVIRSRLLAEGIDFDPTGDLDWSDRARPETWAAIREISARGHRQAILTNDASTWLGAGWWTTWEEAGRFDVIVDVATVGVRKPSPEPYLAVAAALQVPPEECLFVDDLPVNCRGAEAVGMRSVLFETTDPPGSMARLLASLV